MTNANVTWVEDMLFVAQGDSGHAVVMDAGESGGGHDLGSRPMEVLLMGLLGCTSMDVVSILKKKRQPVQGLKVFASGERNQDYPMYYTAIHLEFVVYGDVDETALARAIELSETKYCGASATLRGVAQITTSYRVERGAVGEPAQQPA
jgi:putative redox protein